MTHHLQGWKRLGGIIAMLALLAVPAWAQQATARFTPNSIYPDETTTYEVVVEGAQSLSLTQPPSVDGLEIVSTSQRQSMQIFNGKMSANITISYGVRAKKDGKFVMPSFRMGDIIVPAATLEVLPMSEDRQKQIEEQERRQREAQREIIGMDLSLTDGPIYVGQAVPMHLTVYFHRNYPSEPLNQPEKEGDAFTLEAFPDQVAQRRSNRPGDYYEYEWQNVLTPLKAGTFDLSFKEAYAVGRGFFGRQQVLLSTEPREVNVLPLPNEGQPADFPGAIGDFRLEQPTLDTAKVQAGEPISMTVVVSGTGNFDRMGPPVLRDSTGWRVYPPEDTFTPKGTLGNEGTKTYKFLLIARDESVKQTPRVAFSFFDPETAKYAEFVTDPLPVEVTPAPPGSRPVIIPKSKGEQASRGPSLLPNMHELGGTTASLRPVFFNSLFLAGQAVPLVAILGLFFWRRQRLRLETDSAYARRVRSRREVTRRLQAAEKAAAGNDTHAFFEEAMRAIQEAVAPRLSREPESLTLHEVEAYLAGADAGEEALSAARTCYEAGDALRFGGLGAANVDLKTELARVKRLVANVEGGRK